MARTERKRQKLKHAEAVMLFARRLRELRTRTGLSQHDLAIRAAINQSYLGRLERGERSPGVDMVDKLARAMNVGIADLFPQRPADPLPLLRARARASFDRIIEIADHDALVMLNPWLVLLRDSLARRR